MNRILTSVICTLSAFVLHAASSPNVVFVITDDQGYGDLGFTGNPVTKTPHLDKLAGESVWLEAAYAFEVRRWPEESGLKIRQGIPALAPMPGCLPSYSAVDGAALPVSSATLRINGQDLETKQVDDNDTSIRFTHRLTKGSYKFSPYFLIDTDGQETELGCYYLSVKPLNP